MTELPLEKKQFKIASISLSVSLMLILLFGSISMLHWAINNKLATANIDTPSQITASLREHQLGCLAKNIYFEAGSEPFEGKIAVGQVTINRTESGIFPDDICKTIYQKNKVYEKIICQFSWVCDRVIVNSKISSNSAYKESMEAAKQVLLEGFRLHSIDQALYYHADFIDPHWKKERVAKIGHHIFYK